MSSGRGSQKSMLFVTTVLAHEHRADGLHSWPEDDRCGQLGQRRHARDVSNSTVGGAAKTHLQCVRDTNMDLYVGETLAEVVDKLQSS
jgi:hypothetical protein